MHTSQNTTRATVLYPITFTLLIAVITAICYYFVLPALSPSAQELIELAILRKTHWTFYSSYILFSLAAISAASTWVIWGARTTHVQKIIKVTPVVISEKKKKECKPKPCPKKSLQILYVLSDGCTKKNVSVELQKIKDFNGFTIGSHPSCGLSINDNTVMLKHVELRIREKHLYVKCLAGKMCVNGAWHEANTQAKIHSGEVISIGGVSLRFSL